MRYFLVKRSVQGACAAVILSAVAAFADISPTPGNPQTNASDRNYDTNQPNSAGGAMQKTEDGANRGLNKVDKGVHKLVRKTKKGGHKAKAATNDALNKVDDSVHDRNTP